MVQLEVAERLAARPGSKIYGVPSVKAAWYADVALAGNVSRSVFWPVPNVDSGLVSFVRRSPPVTDASREEVFACVDAAFASAHTSGPRSRPGRVGARGEAHSWRGLDPRTGAAADVHQFDRHRGGQHDR